MIKLIFDIDDTLYDLAQPFLRTHELVFPGRTAEDAGALYDRSRELAEMLLEKETSGKMTKEASFRERIRLTYEEAGVSMTEWETEQYWKCYRKEQTHIVLFPGMAELLELSRKEGILLGILSNGVGEGQLRKCRVLGLDRWFPAERIFISGDIGANKPDPEAFRYVERRTGHAPEELVMVGDSIANDITGAARSGWRSVWFNHRRRDIPRDGCARPDFEAHSVRELRDIIMKKL